jgi:hypothetical protein
LDYARARSLIIYNVRGDEPEVNAENSVKYYREDVKNLLVSGEEKCDTILKGTYPVSGGRGYLP